MNEIILADSIMNNLLGCQIDIKWMVKFLYNFSISNKNSSFITSNKKPIGLVELKDNIIAE